MDKIKRRDFMKLAIATVASTVAPRIIAKQMKPLRNLEEIYHITAIEYDERIYGDFDFYEGTQQPKLTDKKRAEEFIKRVHNLPRRTTEFDCSYRLLVGDIITIDIPETQMNCRIIRVKQLWES